VSEKSLPELEGGEFMKILRVVVQETEEKPTVEVSVPLKLAKWALKLIPVVEEKIKSKTDFDIDINALQGLLDEGFDELEELEEFDFVKVHDDDTDIRISIETK
jgi:hypothetical protein